MAGQEETLQLLERLLQGRETGMSELRNYAEQTARQAVSTEAVARHLQDQKITCQSHIGELASLHGEMTGLSSRVSSLVEKLDTVLSGREYRVKSGAVWVQVIVAALTLTGVIYTVQHNRVQLTQEQNQIEKTVATLADNQQAMVATLKALEQRK